MKISKKQKKIQEKINKLLLAGIPLTALIASAGCGKKIENHPHRMGELPNYRSEEFKENRLMGEPPNYRSEEFKENRKSPEKELDQSGKTKHFPSDNNNRPEEPTKNTDQENPIISTQGIIYTPPQKK